MKNASTLLAALILIILMSSSTDKKANEFIGTYGVSESDPSQIKLTINSDYTFYYQDFSVPDNKIVVHGKWSQKGKKVFLTNNEANKKFHKVWKFEKEGQVAKSRKGLCYYRLGKVKE